MFVVQLYGAKEDLDATAFPILEDFKLRLDLCSKKEHSSYVTLQSEIQQHPPLCYPFYQEAQAIQDVPVCLLTLKCVILYFWQCTC